MSALEHPVYHSVGPADAILLGILRELIAIHAHLETAEQPASSTEAATPAQPASQGKRAVLQSK